jgi:D-3-phosphoglycerate dehydrogenase
VLKALLLENIHPIAVEELSRHGIESETMSGALDENELIEKLAGVHFLGIRSKTEVTAEVLENAPDLLAVGAFCIGTNQINLRAAAARGVAVFNAPFSNTRSVVELALAEIIALTRRLSERDKSLHDGVWDKSAAGAHEVRGRTLGIVGYGNIGTQLSVIAEAIGMRVVFFDIAERLALGNAVRMHSMNELLETADIVSLHVDGRAGNAGLFGREQFSRMKSGSVFLNLSRGFVVDNQALREAIEAKHIVGAALDVFPTEPKTQGDVFESELRGLPNVILTPHIGGSTEEAQMSIGEFVAGKFRDYLLTGTTTLSANLPLLAPQDVGTNHRMAFLHLNTPGVLAAVNQTFANYGVNIEGQQLATRGETGYVVTDVSTPIAPELVAELRGMDSSIRLRILN